MDHTWVSAATLPLTDRQAAHAQRRGSIRVPEGTKIDVLEVYCEACRRTIDDVDGGEPCIAAEDNTHLRGGPIGTRRPRTHDHDCSRYPCSGGGIPPSTMAALAETL